MVKWYIWNKNLPIQKILMQTGFEPATLCTGDTPLIPLSHGDHHGHARNLVNPPVVWDVWCMDSENDMQFVKPNQIKHEIWMNINQNDRY